MKMPLLQRQANLVSQSSESTVFQRVIHCLWWAWQTLSLMTILWRRRRRRACIPSSLPFICKCESWVYFAFQDVSEHSFTSDPCEEFTLYNPPTTTYIFFFNQKDFVEGALGVDSYWRSLTSSSNQRLKSKKSHSLNDLEVSHTRITLWSFREHFQNWFKKWLKTYWMAKRGRTDT